MSSRAMTIATASTADIWNAVGGGLEKRFESPRPANRGQAGGTLDLVGRRHECEELDGLVASARAGEGRLLVLRGEAGVGKTALLQYLIAAVPDLQVARAAGVESEMELAFAGLHRLCGPMLDRLARLPAPQREALRIVFGLSEGTVPDRFLVGLGVLSLLAAVAEERPLLCVVDDAQWLDQASARTLAFVARRLFAEPVGLVFAVRAANDELRGLPELVVHGLPDREASELLSSVIAGPLDPRIRERLISESHGNPLALLELPRALSPAELGGGLVLPKALPVPARIEQSFQRRFETLPADTQLLLLLAAAEPAGDPAILLRAAGPIGLSIAAARHAETAGLLEIGAAVRFRHPLVRSAIYRSASLADRRRVHAALAEATDPEVNPDRRAWHRAEAVSGPDESVAADLESSARRAQARHGLGAAAAFLERAVGLTPDPGPRAQRALMAAQAKHMAGAPDAAMRLLAIVEAGPLDELGQARGEMLRAQIAFASSRGSDAPPLLLQAAKRLETLDHKLARETYLDALFAGQFAGSLAPNHGVREIAQAALDAPPPPDPPRPSDLLLTGLATRSTKGYVAAAPTLKLALGAFRSEGVSADEELRWLWLACRGAVDLWDHEMWDALATRHVLLARDAGALSVLHLALSQRIAASSFAGEVAAATALIDEVQAISEVIGSHVPPYGVAVAAAWRGHEGEESEVIDAIGHEALNQGEALGLAVAEWAWAVIYNGLGRYDKALTAAEQASVHPEWLGISNWALAELILAAVRSGNHQRAATALERLAEMTRASGSDWALGIEARSRALLGEGEAAEKLYLEAIERLGRSGVRVELGRAHLQYGEWLRGERRRLEARGQLRTAHEMLTAMGVEAFAERAERELRATGERARKRRVETRDDLTAQELQVARLAREGLSNPEIGGRLFISPRTVEYHLHKVFTKLGIRSRSQLDRALPTEISAALTQ